MAALHSTPISDAITVEEALLLLEPTGYPVSESTLQRWLVRAGVPRERVGKAYYYSMTDVLEIHRDMTDGPSRN